MGHFIGQDIHPCNLLQQYKYIIRVTTDSSWCYESSHDQYPPVHSASLFTSAQMILLILICQLQHWCWSSLLSLSHLQMWQKWFQETLLQQPTHTSQSDSVSTKYFTHTPHYNQPDMQHHLLHSNNSGPVHPHNLCWTDNNGLFHSLISAWRLRLW